MGCLSDLIPTSILYLVLTNLYYAGILNRGDFAETNVTALQRSFYSIQLETYMYFSSKFGHVTCLEEESHPTFGLTAFKTCSPIDFLLSRVRSRISVVEHRSSGIHVSQSNYNIKSITWIRYLRVCTMDYNMQCNTRITSHFKRR